MPWLQLKINTSPELAPAIEKACTAEGALAVTLEDNADQPIFEPALGETPLWQNTRVTALYDAEIETGKKLADIEKNLRLSLLDAHWHILEDKDWEREWIQHFKPIECAPNLWICPSWLEPPRPDAINLLLDPGLAFGTGTHPTTFLCMAWLAKQNIKNKRVVDYGCGSGILGVASLLLGASSVCGIDIDHQALLATQENTKRNNLDISRFPVFFPDKCPREKADIVVANILAGPLVELADTLTGLLNKDGLLCLSGVLKSQYTLVEARYQKEFDIVEVEEKDEWICISGIKR